MVLFTNNALCQSWKRADRKKKREKKEWHVNNWGKKRHARSPHNNNSKWKSFQGGELCKERNVGEVKPQQVICGLWWKSFSLENLSPRRPPFSRTPQGWTFDLRNKSSSKPMHLFHTHWNTPVLFRNGTVLVTNSYGSCWCGTYLLPHPRGTDAL